MGRFKVTPETEKIHCRVKISDNPEADGTILRQKGTTRFIVTDGTNTGVCLVSDSEDDNLIENTMTLSVIKNDGTIIRVEQFNNKFAIDFDKNRYFLRDDIDVGIHENVTTVTDDIKQELRQSDKTVKVNAPSKVKAVEKSVKSKPKRIATDPTRMNKELLQEHGKSLGIDLDTSKTKKDMLVDLKEFQNSAKEVIQDDMFVITDESRFFVATDLE